LHFVLKKEDLAAQPGTATEVDCDFYWSGKGSVAWAFYFASVATHVSTKDA
jgi:hypothetical protein